jgi:hypothetical protein
MPNPMPPADRKHGTGDRNDNEVARMDHTLQKHRDAEETRDAKEANRQAKHEEGIEHP